MPISTEPTPVSGLSSSVTQGPTTSSSGASASVQPDPEDEEISNGLDEDTETTEVLEVEEDTIFLIDDLTFPEPALVTSFSAYFVNDGDIQFQIWRPLSAGVFSLIAKFDFVISGAPLYYQVI